MSLKSRAWPVFPFRLLASPVPDCQPETGRENETKPALFLAGRNPRLTFDGRG